MTNLYLNGVTVEVYLACSSSHTILILANIHRTLSDGFLAANHALLR